jgi:hypothetical protein
MSLHIFFCIDMCCFATRAVQNSNLIWIEIGLQLVKCLNIKIEFLYSKIVLGQNPVAGPAWLHPNLSCGLLLRPSTDPSPRERIPCPGSLPRRAIVPLDRLSAPMPSRRCLAPLTPAGFTSVRVVGPKYYEHAKPTPSKIESNGKGLIPNRLNQRKKSKSETNSWINPWFSCR